MSAERTAQPLLLLKLMIVQWLLFSFTTKVKLIAISTLTRRQSRPNKQKTLIESLLTDSAFGNK